MTAVFLVFVGGGVGAVLRYLGVQAAFAVAGLGAAWAVMVVNVVGCLLMGMGLALAERGMLGMGSTATQVLLLTGVLGGFTTFSAFSADVLKMAQSGDYAVAGLYVLGSVGLSLLAVAGGYYLMTGRTA